MTDAWQAHRAHHFHTDDILELAPDDMIYDPTIPAKYHHPDFLDECLALACCVTSLLILPWSWFAAAALFVCSMSFFVSANSYP